MTNRCSSNNPFEQNDKKTNVTPLTLYSDNELKIPARWWIMNRLKLYSHTSRLAIVMSPDESRNVPETEIPQRTDRHRHRELNLLSKRSTLFIPHSGVNIDKSTAQTKGEKRCRIHLCLMCLCFWRRLNVVLVTATAEGQSNSFVDLKFLCIKELTTHSITIDNKLPLPVVHHAYFCLLFS